MSLSPRIRWTLRAIEWILLGSFAVGLYLNRGVSQILGASVGLPMVYVLTWTLLSFWIPFDQAIWIRRLYVVIEISLVSLSRLMGLNFQILLYIFLAKSLFILSRKEALVVGLVAGLSWHAAYAYTLPGRITLMQEQLQAVLASEGYQLNLVLTSLGCYLAIYGFVILFGSVVLAEQRSRLQAEALTQKIDTLATTLERTRIARDIHDSLGHLLTTLDAQLELATKLTGHNPTQVPAAVLQAKQLSSECLQEVRRAVHTMRQSAFDLDEALKSLITQMQHQHSLSIEMSLQLPLLPLHTSHQLYCIIQEGLTNIQKHARATQVTLWGSCTPTGLKLELRDNGIGFDPNASMTGYGLRGMRERSQMIGGDLDIRTAPGQGTSIRVTVPY